MIGSDFKTDISAELRGRRLLKAGGVPGRQLRGLGGANPAGLPVRLPLTILNSAADAVTILSGSFEIRVANRAAETLTRIDRDRLAGMSLLDLISPASRSSIRQKLHASHAGGEALLELRNNDGEVFLQARWSPIAADGAGWLLIARDVTDSIRRDERNAATRRILEMLAAGAPFAEVLEDLCRFAERQVKGSVFVASVRSPEGRFIAAGSHAGFEIAEYLYKNGNGGAPSRVEGVLSDGRIRLTDSRLASGSELAGRYPYRISIHCPSSDQDVLFAYRSTSAAPTAHEMAVMEESAALLDRIVEHERLRLQLRRQGYTDAITGLPNCSAFLESLETMISSSKRGEFVGILYVDLDDFKISNDMAGHAFGNKVLRTAAARIREVLPADAVIARIAGDEFGAAIPRLSATGQVREFAAAVLDALRSRNAGPCPEQHILASIGVAVCPSDGVDAEILLSRAHTALWQAKTRGKAQFCMHDERLARMAARRCLIHHYLPQALEKGELRLVYQPQMELATGRITGVEALLRWDNAALGKVSPADFIPVAEQTGLIVPIGKWVLEQACQQASRWSAQRSSRLRVAVNVSGVQLMRPDFVATVANALHSADLPPRELEIEVTESVTMTDFADCVSRLKELRALGVSVAIDDFGTGYASLSCLGSMPVNALKIDRSFIAELGAESNAALSVAIIEMGRALGLRVTAEGVESTAQLEKLRALGCDSIQGFLISPPREPAAFGDIGIPETVQR